jgi:hypothetical protein
LAVCSATCRSGGDRGGVARRQPTPGFTHQFEPRRPVDIVWIASKTVVFEAQAALNGVEPLAWLTDVLKRMVSGRAKAHELERLLPWNWKAERLSAAVNA